jgi:LPS-assembly protein
VDSPWSRGAIRTGYFKDKSSFVTEHNLKNASHYGFELNYESSNFLRQWKPEGYRDGFYANLNLFNDIDYNNLQYRTLSHLEETSRFKESRVNYFLYNDRQYFGVRARYFIDTTRTENNETIQELPALQYHKFSAKLGSEYFHYSFDTQVNNYWRKDGVRALRGIASFPLEFHMPLLDDYLNLTVEEKLKASDTKFMQGRSLHITRDHYAALSLQHNIELSSDLIRGYESGIHTMLLGIGYTKSTLLAEGDLHYQDIDSSLISDFDLDTSYDSRISLKMHHFWQSYSMPFRLDYLMVADYFPENDSRWNSLHQEFGLHYGHYALMTRLDYSLRYHALSEFSNTFAYDGEKLGIFLTHTRKEYENDTHELAQNDMSFRLRYHPTDQWTWYGGYSYDFKEKRSKNWETGFTFDRKCWNVTLMFKQDITPILTHTGQGSLRNNAVIFQFNLVPFGGVGSSQTEKYASKSDS